MKNKVSKVLYYTCIVVWFWVTLTTIIQRFKAPEMTESEIFINIPKSFVLIFNTN